MSREQNLDIGSFLTVSDVAARLNVSKMTVYRLVHSGEMPAVHIGHSFRINETAVAAYLAEAAVEADPSS
ncbi:helix-turn-helix domain-containing protein [Arthrobacter crystallopoietes]|uniref:helix-turn-helix domain-containing protein n=1 Tax=Crystallibacter crystallopoietes TaxID=37928 RepID=UPI0011112A6D|nr:helix-turn-helix domain-containing protein [Arthrobacter crystallopoietes]QTG79663.1 helix-turn-helix domain-containing protein [Arthrobacter crystallopoietes]